MTEQELVEELRIEIRGINRIYPGLADLIVQQLLPIIRTYAAQSATSAVRERDEEWKKALSGKGDVGPALAWKESIAAEERERCANVAMAYKTECLATSCGIAAAIRALDKEPSKP